MGVGRLPAAACHVLVEISNISTVSRISAVFSPPPPARTTYSPAVVSIYPQAACLRRAPVEGTEVQVLEARLKIAA